MANAPANPTPHDCNTVAEHYREGLLGWPTDPLTRLDDLSSGLISRFLVAKPVRRQAINLVLADLAASGECGLTADLAELLKFAGAGEIVLSHFGALPDGLLGALERIGPNPLKPASYGVLRRIYSERRFRRHARALRHLEQITDGALEALLALDPRWVHLKVLQTVCDGAQATQLNHALAFVQDVNSAATDAAVMLAVRKLSPDYRLEALVCAFLHTADRAPPGPLAADPEVQPLSVADLPTMARRYRNCLDNDPQIGDLIRGRRAFAEFSGSAILEFRPLEGGGWLLAGVHGRHNGRVPPDLTAAAKAKCRAFGIHTFDQKPDDRWSAVTRLMRRGFRMEMRD